jgi:RimJ/RimL family protein N-acetyltransferase
MSTEQSPFPQGFTLSTPRLQITPLDPTDHTHCTFLVRLWNTDDFINSSGKTGLDTPEKAAKFIENRVIPSYARNRYAQFLVSLHDGKQIGIVSLMKGSPLDSHYYTVPDVGFTILPEESGKGYATEAGKRLLEYARKNLNIEGAFGFCDPENVRSRRVLEKLGMVYRGVGDLVVFGGQRTAVYALPDMGDLGVYHLTENLEV